MPSASGVATEARIVMSAAVGVVFIVIVVAIGATARARRHRASERRP
jgi:hypothetical protein